MRAVLLAAALAVIAFPATAGERPVDAVAQAMTAVYGQATPTLWGERMPGITSRLPAQNPSSAKHTVALTLDACGGVTDTGIITLLREHGVPATVFVTDIWLRRNAALARDMARDPLVTLAAHGSHHKPASVTGRAAYGIAGTASVADLVAEVEPNARAITRLTGARPRWFRSGTAYYDDVAVAVIRDLGLGVAGYTVNADEGASLPAAEVARRLTEAPDRAIIIMHLNRPAGGTGKGLAAALPVMLERGVLFLPLP